MRPVLMMTATVLLACVAYSHQQLTSGVGELIEDSASGDQSRRSPGIHLPKFPIPKLHPENDENNQKENVGAGELDDSALSEEETRRFRFPKFPKLPKIPKIPKIPKAPKAPKAPKPPKLPKPPKSPKIPKPSKGIKVDLERELPDIPDFGSLVPDADPNDATTTSAPA